ncbi:hypothetical protein F3K34_13195 [Streptomyces sp. LBUM 1486]|uniref:hypothetical protein n=1 Tax=Streptomyces scabiei TaxID=1930 RepID=UPI001B33F6F1|nr:hypothetical protein [Streptomyces sp. LBUM 1486]MBP5913190.1 hypothetical protein [Streptomyces sp. LBUM 1486]
MRRSSLSRRQHDDILAAQQRRHEAELGKLTAELADVTRDRNRLRVERDDFKRDRDAYKSAAETARKQLAQHTDPLPVLPPDVRSLQAYVRRLEKQLDDATSIGDIGVPAREDWRRRPETAAGS